MARVSEEQKQKFYEDNFRQFMGSTGTALPS